MTKTANVIFTTQKQDRPEGVVVGGFLVSLLLSGVVVGSPVTVADAAAPVVFTLTNPGDYTVSVVRVAASGEAISPVVQSTVFTVIPDQIDVPLSVSVFLSELATVDVPVAVAVAVTG